MSRLYGPAYVKILLRSSSFRFSTEDELQAGIEQLLRNHGISFVREADLGAAGRIDFLVGSGFGVEVKTSGSPAAVLRQLQGYALSRRIDSLLLVTSRLRLSSAMPTEIGGKPLATCRLQPRI